MSVTCSAAHFQHHLGLLDPTSEECLRLLRPLLEILLSASEVLRTTEVFHNDETRSVIPNLSCREIVDCSHCIGKSRFCCHLISQREQLLLTLRHNLQHRHRHRHSSEFRKFVQQAIAATRQGQHVPANSRSLQLPRETPNNCSSCVSPHAGQTSHHDPANKVHQGTRHQSTAPTASCPPHKQRVEQRSLRSRGRNKSPRASTNIDALDLLSPLRKNPLLQRSMLSSSEASIQTSQCGYRSEPPIPSCSSPRLGRQQSPCPRRL